MKPQRQKPASMSTGVTPAQASEHAAFVVRGGFTLHHKNKVYRAGEIVDLTAAEHASRQHMVEPTPAQEAK